MYMYTDCFYLDALVSLWIGLVILSAVDKLYTVSLQSRWGRYNLFSNFEGKKSCYPSYIHSYLYSSVINPLTVQQKN